MSGFGEVSGSGNMDKSAVSDMSELSKTEVDFGDGDGINEFDETESSLNHDKLTNQERENAEVKDSKDTSETDYDVSEKNMEQNGEVTNEQMMEPPVEELNSLNSMEYADTVSNAFEDELIDDTMDNSTNDNSLGNEVSNDFDDKMSDASKDDSMQAKDENADTSNNDEVTDQNDTQNSGEGNEQDKLEGNGLDQQDENADTSNDNEVTDQNDSQDSGEGNEQDKLEGNGLDQQDENADTSNNDEVTDQNDSQDSGEGNEQDELEANGLDQLDENNDSTETTESNNATETDASESYEVKDTDKYKEVYEGEHALQVDELADKIKDTESVAIVGVDSATLWDQQGDVACSGLFQHEQYSDHWITVDSPTYDESGNVEGFHVVDSDGGVDYVNRDKFESMYIGDDNHAMIDPTAIIVSNKENELAKGDDGREDVSEIGTAKTWKEFQDDPNNKARYESVEETRDGYIRVVEEESPWPDGEIPEFKELPTGTKFEMAMAHGQPDDMPGAFGTFSHIENKDFIRNDLAVKEDWKPDIDRINTYEVIKPLPANVGNVGPQVDVPADKYLSGGADQLEMKVSTPERMQYIKLIDSRKVEES